jgi:Neuraminidase (sialidase)
MTKQISITLVLLSLFTSCSIFKSTEKSKVDVTNKKQVTETGVVTIMSNDNIYSALSEPSICINKTDTNNIIAGSIYDNVHISNDKGKTWQTQHLQSKFGVFGDPCLVSDNFGNIYYLHLANPDNNRNSPEFLSSIVIQKSTDKGKTWTDGVAIGYNKTTDQDKHWIGIQPETGELAVTWTEFDKYGSKNPKHHSRILFSKSTDFGKTWTNPIKINEFEGDCIDDDQTTEGAVPVFDREGNIYVTWSFDHKIYFDKSLDGGKTWLKQDIVVATQPEGWNYNIPGVYRANGFPILDIDISGGKYNGTLYVNWTDQRNGTDNTDVFISKSTDKGKTWSKPKKVNTDNTRTHQYLSWMKIDPATGFIYIVYYDRSAYKDTKTDVVLSVSKDGGETFTKYTVSEQPFTPKPYVFMGDYNNIDAYNGIVTPVWTNLNKGVISIKTKTLFFGQTDKK